MKDDMELKRALDALPRAIEPPAEAWAGIHAKIAIRPSEQSKPRRGFVWPEHFEPKTIRIAAGIAAIGIGLTYLGAGTRADSQWSYSAWVTTTGARQVPWRQVAIDRPVRAGDVLTTPENGWALIHAGSFGRISVSPGTEMRLINARPIEQRVTLAHGAIEARLDAPPRLFVVETPAGIVTDMGCSYRLDVYNDRLSRLTVAAGWVTFNNHGSEALVPQGFTVFMRPGQRAGTPVFTWASPELRRAVDRFDYDPADRAAVADILAAAGKNDAVTLWHMLPWVNLHERGLVYDRLAQLAPPPDGVTRNGIVNGMNPIMLRLWWEQLPGALKIDSGLRTKLWTLWLRVASWL